MFFKAVFPQISLLWKFFLRKRRYPAPDWVAIDRNTGKLQPTDFSHLKTDYSFDAIRVPWRIALDYSWNNDQRARQYLQSNFQILTHTYQKTAKLPLTFAHDGAIVNEKENPAAYAASLGYFMVTDKKLAEKIYREKAITLYSNDINSFKKDILYYEQNWLWFETALYHDYLQPFI